VSQGEVVQTEAVTSSVPEDRGRRSFVRSVWFIVLVAFVLRLAVITVGHTYRITPRRDHFQFGWEMGRVGAALASGRGFSDPFGPPTGPTAWEPPLYPYLMAGVFRLFGVYSHASAFVLLTFSSLCSAVTCVPIFRMAKRCFGETVAVGSAWVWALLPSVMFWSTKVVWETSLSALLLTTLFLLTLEMEDRDGLRPWLEFGLLWGIAALNSTVLLSFLPASELWALYRRSRRGKRSLGGVVVASALFIACLLFGFTGEELDSGPVAMSFWFCAAVLPWLYEQSFKQAAAISRPLPDLGQRGLRQEIYVPPEAV